MHASRGQHDPKHSLWVPSVFPVPEQPLSPLSYMLTQMRVRPLLLARSAICVGLALCHARQGLPYPYLRALVGNSICVLTGSLLDLYRRRLFMHATEAASASSATACTDGGVVAPGLAGAGRAVGPSSSKTVGKPHAE